jgi:hypothetical protein
MNPLIIILGVVIIIILFFIIKYYYNTTTLVKNINLNTNPADISSNVITNPSSVLYSFGTWIYVNNFANNRIISYKDNKNPAYFSLILGGITLSNGNRIGIQNSPTLSVLLNINGKPENIIVTNNFPIQKWVYVTVCVDTTFCDCYLDGKLIVSKQIPQILTGQAAAIKFGNFDVNNNVNGNIYLANVNRWDHPLDPQSVWREYSAGNGLSENNISVGLSVSTDSNTKNYRIY